ncbi:MAG TPA: hypothetical protein VFU22_03085 [Roseiflexaceae bacterium]|nr:hypothetical protein [Roseiflexaceae bacterium]
MDRQGSAVRRSIWLLAVCVVICGAGALLATRPPVARLIAPGATNVRVHELGLGQRLLTYDAAGGRYDWYYSVASGLEQNGWNQPNKWGPAEQYNIYTQVTPLWIGFLWEQVELRGGPHQARITLRRWVSISWKFRLVSTT